MHPVLLFGLGAALGVTRERLYAARERKLSPKETLKHLAKGFTTEVVSTKDFILGKKREETVYVITVEDSMTEEEVLAVLAEKILDRRERPKVKSKKTQEVVPVSG